MRHLLKLSLPAIAASLLIAACGGSSSSNTTSSAAGGQPAAQRSSGPSSAAVKTASNATLGTILVDSRGMTLYHLGGEQNGQFICTSSACLGVWHPLTAPSPGAPSGEVDSLGTVQRPDGTMQVTYRGTPLYTFAEDQQPGETKGQGIKDVGTWSAVTISSSNTSPSTTSTSNTSPSTTSTSNTSPSTTSTSSTPPSKTSTPATPAPASGGGYGY